MNFNKVTTNIIDLIKQIVGNNFVFSDEQTRTNYGHDETDFHLYPPEVVVKPRTPEEISEILIIANKEMISVTVRGAGTGLTGGALPVRGGILISMERFNEILEIDTRNLQATVEPGVINEVFQNKVKEHHLFYPPDPASKGSCFLGGNVAESSGGPKCVKYGTTKDYIINLQVVLPTGEIIFTGANTLKNATGYNLTQLMIGSEGTLGVVTKIIVRLIPLPKYDLLMLVPFKNIEQACEFVSVVFRSGFIPSAMEMMERDALMVAAKFIDNTSVKIEDDIQAHLLIEVDGNDINVLNKEMEAIAELACKFEVGEILFAESAAQKEELFKLRRKINEAVRATTISKEQDTVVPRAELPKLMNGVKALGNKYNFKSVCYGHAGDGNLHIRLIKGNLTDEQWDGSYMKNVISELFMLCKKLGGTISGEHGIGWIQKGYTHLVFNEKEIEIQKNIKKVFDPNGILNPDKMFL